MTPASELDIGNCDNCYQGDNCDENCDLGKLAPASETTTAEALARWAWEVETF